MQDSYTICVRNEIVVGPRLLPGRQDFAAVNLTTEQKQLQNDWQDGGSFRAGPHRWERFTFKSHCTPFLHMSDWTSPNKGLLTHWMRNQPASCQVTHNPLAKILFSPETFNTKPFLYSYFNTMHFLFPIWLSLHWPNTGLNLNKKRLAFRTGYTFSRGPFKVFTSTYS